MLANRLEAIYCELAMVRERLKGMLMLDGDWMESFMDGLPLSVTCLLSGSSIYHLLWSIWGKTRWELFSY